MRMRVRQILALCLTLLLLGGPAPGFCGGLFEFAPPAKKAKSRGCGPCCKTQCCCCPPSSEHPGPRPADDHKPAPRDKCPGCPPACCCTSAAPLFFNVSLPPCEDGADHGEVVLDLACETPFVPGDGPFHPPR